MVCIPCIVIPFFLFIWHRFIQPYVLRYWNPWKKVDNKGEPAKNGALKCPIKSKTTETKTSLGTGMITTKETVTCGPEDKKNG